MTPNWGCGFRPIRRISLIVRMRMELLRSSWSMKMDGSFISLSGRLLVPSSVRPSMSRPTGITFTILVISQDLLQQGWPAVHWLVELVQLVVLGVAMVLWLQLVQGRVLSVAWATLPLTVLGLEVSFFLVPSE